MALGPGMPDVAVIAPATPWLQRALLWSEAGGFEARLFAGEISRGHRWRTAQTRLPFRVVTCVSDRAAAAEIPCQGSEGALYQNVPAEVLQQRCK